jgi:hypothetical protein
MAANNIYIQATFNSESAQQNVNALNQAIGQTGPTAEKSSKQATTALATVTVSVQQVNREFQQLTTALAGLGISRAIGGMVQVAADLSRAQLAMQSFTGSAEEANKVFEQVRAIAAQSPFRFKDLEQTARQLLGFGLAAKNVPDTLRTITDQVARMGGSIENVNTIVRLFGRIMEKDFVGAMDLLRLLPAQGIPVMKALGAEIERALGHAVNTEDIKNAIKEGLLDPLQTVRVVLDAMRQSGGFGAMIVDAAMAFKNLADTVEYAAGKFFGPDGFGPALTHLAAEIQGILAPLGGLLDAMMKLPEPTKELIVNILAITAGVAAFGTALGILVNLAGPLLGLVKALWEFVAALAAMNPELTVAVVLIGGLSVALYKFIPAFKDVVDKVVDYITTPIKNLFRGLSEDGKKWYTEFIKGMEQIPKGDVIDTSKLWDKASADMEKFASTAQRTLLTALSSPVEAVQVKYAQLFQELEEKFKPGGPLALLTEGQKQTLRDTMTGARGYDLEGALFKKDQQARDEATKLNVERVKGSYEAQIAYIEALDEQDLRKKVAAIDQITQLRIDAAKQVAQVEKDNLTAGFEAQRALYERHRTEFAALGIDVDQAIADRRQEMQAKQAVIDQKAVDEGQKYRLEGWKKANDAIIEDQKRVFEAFKSGFDEIFDAFTQRTKSIGQALGDVFKKLALGEVRNLFSTQMASFATEAAGYGRPASQITRGGILGTLLQRGMPPRAPGPPPEAYTPARSESVFTPLTNSANRMSDAADLQMQAALIMAGAARNMSGASVSHTGSANRMADAGEAMGDASDAIQRASAATGVSQPLLRAVAQVESGMRPGLTSSKGAKGLMQLMPLTMQDWGVTNPFDPQQSAMAGAQQLKRLLTRYGGSVPLALAAYNFGPANLDRAMAKGAALPAETQNYIRKVTALLTPGEMQGVTSAETFGGGRSGGGGASASWAYPPFQMPGQATAPQYPSISLPPDIGALTLGPSPADVDRAKSGGLLADINRIFGGGVTPGAPPVGGTPTSGGGGFNLPLGLGKVSSLAGLGELFGVYPGLTSAGSVLTSRDAGALYTLGGMALASKGLQQHYAPATAIGGGMAGLGTFLSSPQMIARASEMPGGVGLGMGAAAATGVGLGLFASGFQRGGGGGLAMDIGGGALAGAGIGTMIAPGTGIGTAIGAAAGAAAGLITGVVRLFVQTEQERIRSQIKQVYGVDITNRSILTQVQQIVDQKYGGSVSVGVRSQEVQDLVRLYALSTGQAANMPRPMYGATVAQSAQGLQLQAVYQGGVQVKNPYSGPTTYQYQTAVASAMGLKSGTSLGVPGAGGIITQQWQQLALETIQGNPAAIANANAAAASAGDSRLTTTAAMQEPLTALS